MNSTESYNDMFSCQFFITKYMTSICDAEFVGMSLSYGLSLNSLVYYTILISCTVENDMVAVERVHQYSNLPSEAAWEVADCLPSPDWPSRGDIDVKDLKVNIILFVSLHSILSN